MISFVEKGAQSLEAAKNTINYVQQHPDIRGPNGEKIIYKRDEVAIKAPVRPEKILGVAVNNKKRVAQFSIKHPILFWKGGSTTVIGDGEEIELPKESLLTHVEVELAVIIGKICRRVPASEAYNYVFGYTVLNDISAEDLFRAYKLEDKSYGERLVGRRLSTEPEVFQKHGVTLVSWVENKNWDTFAPIGPWIVTRDELPNPHDPPLHYTAKVNDKIVQDGDADLYWKIPEIIEKGSKVMTLKPGDIITTGTVSPILPIHVLKPGDFVEATINKIGTIRNNCVLAP